MRLQQQSTKWLGRSKRRLPLTVLCVCVLTTTSCRILIPCVCSYLCLTNKRLDYVSSRAWWRLQNVSFICTQNPWKGPFSKWPCSWCKSSLKVRAKWTGNESVYSPRRKQSYHFYMKATLNFVGSYYVVILGSHEPWCIQARKNWRTGKERKP